MQMYGEEWAARYEEYANASIAGREGLFRLLDASLSSLPEEARILVAGCGTGSELLELASRHPGWRFEAVDPSGDMLDVCRRRLNEAAVSGRVTLHQQGVERLRIEACDGATSILVSQHAIDDQAAVRFFSEIARNLASGAPLFSADISLPDEADRRDALLGTWKQQAVSSGLPQEAPASMVSRFGQDLVPRSPTQIEDILRTAGFRLPMQVFQSTIYRAWVSQRTD